MIFFSETYIPTIILQIMKIVKVVLSSVPGGSLVYVIFLNVRVFAPEHSKERHCHGNAEKVIF